MPENNDTNENRGSDKSDTPGQKKSIRDFAVFAGVGFQMMAVIGVCAFIGYKLDEYYHHETQWITALSGVFGVCISIYQTIRQLKS
ncbi:MAG: hypothetical protein JWN56_602 [Sphingobacteriales bacterium]|nr:hypothetical protein [Sphingobacteriales bacterium]